MTTQLYLTPADQGRRLSLEEFESARGQEGYHYELINGRLEVSPLPGLSHEDFRDWLRDPLFAYSRQHPGVINYLKSPARVFLPEADEVTAPEPDLAAYHDFPVDRLGGGLDWSDVSPVLVAEVVSADTADKDLERNVRLYLQVPSIREYWILDPRDDFARPSLIARRRRGRRWQRAIRVAGGGTYTTPLLPGFTLVLDRSGGNP
jgi:Uma2 family endonuclease